MPRNQFCFDVSGPGQAEDNAHCPELDWCVVDLELPLQFQVCRHGRKRTRVLHHPPGSRSSRGHGMQPWLLQKVTCGESLIGSRSLDACFVAGNIGSTAAPLRIGEALFLLCKTVRPLTAHASPSTTSSKIMNRLCFPWCFHGWAGGQMYTHLL